MRYVGIPAVVSTSAAPFGLIGGWALAAYMWPEYDPIRQTISELAAGDAPTAVMMNAMFVLAGICHLTSAVFLYAVAIPGRAILAVGGLASIALAWFPLPTVDSTTTAHRVVAGISFIALAIWPAFGWRRRPASQLLSAFPMILATVVMLALCGWFFLVWDSEGAITGFVERTAVGAEVLFPGLVAWMLVLRERARRGRFHF